jgi:hypothetical protein
VEQALLACIILVSDNGTVQMNDGTSGTSCLNAFLEANWII